MADPLYLSLWFPEVAGPEIIPHILAVMQQFPFSEQRPGITYIAVHPVSWNEASVLERRFAPGIAPEEALVIAADLVHDDYAYVFDAYWDLWIPSGGSKARADADDSTKAKNNDAWQLVPSRVRFVARGEEFDDGAYQQNGQVEVDFGLDSVFLLEGAQLNEETQAKVRDNVAKLIEFSRKAEKNTRSTARLLWSESQENLAQKLLARLQRVQ